MFNQEIELVPKPNFLNFYRIILTSFTTETEPGLVTNNERHVTTINIKQF